MSASPPCKDLLLFAEHDPVFTLGRRPDMRHVLFDVQRPPTGHAVHQVERGGEVTFHGPGQLMCYPILRLKQHRMDLRWCPYSRESPCIGDTHTHPLTHPPTTEGTFVAWRKWSSARCIGTASKATATTSTAAYSSAPTKLPR